MDLYQNFKKQEILKGISPGKIVVAVSGGADSVCLLHCVKRLYKGLGQTRKGSDPDKERRWQPTVVHIQHHLRGKASILDQKFVEGLAAKWGFDWRIREIRPPKEKGTEEKSRILRYHQLAEAAKELGAAVVLT